MWNTAARLALVASCGAAALGAGLLPAQAAETCSTPGACPAITSVVPNALSFNRAANATLAVTGSKLDVVSSVLLEPGDTPTEFHLETSDHMSVTLPVAVAAGSHWLVLTSPFGDSDQAPRPQFQVIAPSLTPQSAGPVVSFEPAPGAAVAPAQTPSSAPTATVAPVAVVATTSSPRSVVPWRTAGVILATPALVLMLALLIARRRHHITRRVPRNFTAAPPDAVVSARLDRL